MPRAVISFFLFSAFASAVYGSEFDNGRSEPTNMLSRLPDKYLEMYHSRSDKSRTGSTSYSVGGSANPLQFSKNLEKHARLDEVMATSSSFSFLFFDIPSVVVSVFLHLLLYMFLFDSGFVLSSVSVFSSNGVVSFVFFFRKKIHASATSSQKITSLNGFPSPHNLINL